MMTKLIAALLLLVASPALAQRADITLPPPESGTRCALVEKGEVKDIRFFDETYTKVGGGTLEADGCPPDLPVKGVQWMPASKAELPVYDPATQVRADHPTAVVGDNVVTEEYEVRDKTPEEIERDKPPVDRFRQMLDDLQGQITALKDRIEELEAAK